VFYGFDGTVANDGSELLHQLLDHGISLNRLLCSPLTLATAPSSSLRRRFLLWCLQLDIQLQSAPMVLVECVVETPMLSGVKQRTLRRVQMHEPAVALYSNQGAVSRNTSGQASESQLQKNAQPLGRQPRGRLNGWSRFSRLWVSLKIVQSAKVGFRLRFDFEVVFVRERRLIIVRLIHFNHRSVMRWFS
jgi:hypothetical protein